MDGLQSTYRVPRSVCFNKRTIVGALLAAGLTVVLGFYEFVCMLT